MLRDRLNLALIAGIAIAICGIAIYSLPTAVKAQTLDTIHIVGKVADTPVSTITFPQGAPGATVSNPYNDVDGVGDPQVLHANASEPVVRLKNTSGGTLTIWLGITAWTESAVASERFKLMDPATTTVESLTSEPALGASASTTVTIAAGAYKALYLEVTLGTGYGKTGSSTLTILGEPLSLIHI